MIQCAECEFGKAAPNGYIEMTCDPVRNIKEEACLLKWQLVKLANIEAMQVRALGVSNSLMPLQAKLLQHNCDQIDALNETDSWKCGGADDESPG